MEGGRDIPEAGRGEAGSNTATETLALFSGRTRLLKVISTAAHIILPFITRVAFSRSWSRDDLSADSHRPDGQVERKGEKGIDREREREREREGKREREKGRE
eukprot:sb/3478188/